MKSYLKFLSSNKLYTAIEAVGLVVSLAFVILTGHYVFQQYEMTRNVDGYQNIYSVACTSSMMSSSFVGCFYGLTEKAAAKIPEIEKTAKYYKEILPGQEGEECLVGGTSMMVRTCLVDKGLLEMFPIRFLEGGPEVLDDQSNVIVSRSFANTLGQDSVLGLSVGDRWKIGAVIEDWDRTLFHPTDIIYNIQSQKDYINGAMNVIPFFRLRPDSDRKAFSAKMEAVVLEVIADNYASEFIDGCKEVRYDELFFSNPQSSPLSTLRGGDRTMLNMMLLVTLILLLSALFNYINLNVALSGRRQKEMAIRRINGADRREIVRRFLLESFFFTTICLAVAWLLAKALLPSVNRLLNASVPIQLRLSVPSVLLYLLAAAVTSVLAALVPATLGVRLQPVAVVKGEQRLKNKRVFSKVFIGIQNVFSILLVVLTLVMQAQMNHMMSRPLGADVENVFIISSPNQTVQQLLGDRLSQVSSVARIGRSGTYPGGMETYFQESREEGLIPYARLACDSVAFDIYRFKIREQLAAGGPGSVWLAESDMKKMGIEPDGEIDYRTVFASRTADRIGGILEEYNGMNILQFDPRTRSFIIVDNNMIPTAYYVLEVRGDHRQAREEILWAYKELCEKVVGSYLEPTEAGFIPELLETQIAREKDKMRMIRIVMLLCLMLSVLGLVAMSAYYASEDARNVALRKVFGGSVRNEVWRSVRAYMLIVLSAAVVAVPLAVYLSGRLLDPYAYRITGYAWMFVAAVLLVLLISFASVLWQTLKAARTNPAVELKKE